MQQRLREAKSIRTVVSPVHVVRMTPAEYILYNQFQKHVAAASPLVVCCVELYKFLLSLI